MVANLSSILRAFLAKAYNITDHGFIEMQNDGVSVETLEFVLAEDQPEVIEDYPDDPRGSCCLILGWDRHGDPVHAVIGYAGSSHLVITVYRPDPARWIDFKRRK